MNRYSSSLCSRVSSGTFSPSGPPEYMRSPDRPRGDSAHALMIVRMEPRVSVVIASERVETLLPACLASLQGQAEDGALEALVASAEPPPRGAVPPHVVIRWVRVASRNPAHRRNLAAREARGASLAFLDDDAEAEPGWAAAGLRALGDAEIVGGPDPGPRDADTPYGERLSD